MRAHFGVDHDYPAKLVLAAKDYLPFDITLIKRIDPRLVDRMDDWQVLLALAQTKYAGLITLDWSILNLPREIAVVHQTRATLVIIEAAGDNPLRAFGQLLVHMTSIAGQYEADSAQLFRIPKVRTLHPERPWERRGEIASGEGKSIKQLYDEVKLTADELEEPVLTPGAR